LPQKKLGSPIRIVVDSPNLDGSGIAIAWVYQDPVYGRFILAENKSNTTQASLEALAGCDHAAGCQGQWTLVKLASGANGLLITGGPTTGMFWLLRGLTMDVFGPIATFSVADAEAVANDL
jgi:hypothetical protein